MKIELQQAPKPAVLKLTDLKIGDSFVFEGTPDIPCVRVAAPPGLPSGEVYYVAVWSQASGMKTAVYKASSSCIATPVHPVDVTVRYSRRPAA
jgi:hypothetical protein